MLLNARNSNFIFSFPKTFVSEKINNKWLKYLQKNNNTTFNSVVDYLNISIQGFTLNGVNIEGVTEMINAEEIVWKSRHIHSIYTKALSKDISITLKALEGYINYFIMNDIFINYLDNNEPNEFFDNFNLILLDNNGFELFTVKFINLVMTSISELNLNYSSIAVDFKTFNVNFKYSYIEYDFKI